jgi:hypothetical protein
MKTHNDNYKQYRSNLYFKSLNCAEMKYQVKHYTDHETEAIIPVVLVSGVCLDDGEEINVRLWPRQNATLKDLEVLKEDTFLDDIKFRIGYWGHKDEKTGEFIVEKEAEPKMVAYRVGGSSWKTLSGKVHAFDPIANTYERWTNDEPETEDEKQDAAEAQAEAKEEQATENAAA